MNLLDRLYVLVISKIMAFKAEFESDERGVSSVVATVLLIVIVVALAAILWAWLKGYFNDLFTGIEADTDTIGK